jgi:hypothetical protein
MRDLVATAEGLLKSLGLNTSQAAVLNAGSDAAPKLLIYIFDERVRDDRVQIDTWHDMPVEVVRVKRPEPLEKANIRYVVR